MPLPQYRLDDRGFDDLVADLLSRIPAHTPEWTNPATADPGVTLIELFAYLADTLLYRANLIPERQRLTFLRLLKIPMRPAQAAQGLIALAPANPRVVQVQVVPRFTRITGPAPFETRGELTVLPLQGQAYAKRRPSDEESSQLASVIAGLQSVYALGDVAPYLVTPLFPEGEIDKRGFDFANDSVDACAWIALLAPRGADLAAVWQALERDQAGSRILNVGVAPQLESAQMQEEITTPASLRSVWEWELSSGRLDANGEPEYLSLDVLLDTTAGFARNGVVRLELPDADDIGAPSNDVAIDYRAGVGSRPPRLDDPDVAGRLLAWLRLRPQRQVSALALSWLGINAIEVDQRRTLVNVVIGVSDGLGDQTLALPGSSVERETLRVQVEEPGRGFVDWIPVDELAAAGRDDRVFELDSEAGSLRFGDGVRGRIPGLGMRIRVETMRYGGGAAGNLAVGNLKGISLAGLKVAQPLPTRGGADAESVDHAEKRIPDYLRHGDRAVTADDYERLAIDTPGVTLGRVEVLPRFKPHQRRSNIPGVVSVMVIPQAAGRQAPNPRPDRLVLERVRSYLEPRRPLATELYVIGVDYVPVAISVAVGITDGAARDEVLRAVRQALRDFLWPLSPGGHSGEGWPLGRAVATQELEVMVARVAGVRVVNGVNLFARKEAGWQLLPLLNAQQGQRLELALWQLPELLAVVVVDDTNAPQQIGQADEMGRRAGVPIPVAREVC